MKVMVNFDMSSHGLRTTRFAVALAAMLGQRLSLRVPMGYRPDEFAEALREKFKIDLGKVDILSSATVAALPAEESTLCVSHETREITQEQAPKGAHILCTHGEDGRRTLREGLRIAVPFGESTSAQRAMKLALLIAQRTVNAVVVGLHTTYHAPGEQSSDPRIHMTEHARDRETELLRMAKEANVTVEVRVAMAADLVNFVLEDAGLDCGLIVTAVGDSLTGSYAHQIERQSHLPVLVVSKEVAS